MSEIRASVPTQVNHRISVSAVAKVHCYFSVIGYNFGRWYQGEKAVQSWNPLLAANFRTAVTEAMKKKLRSEELSAANDFAEVIALSELTTDAAASSKKLKQRVKVSEIRDSVVQAMKAQGVRAVNMSAEVSVDEVNEAVVAITAVTDAISNAVARFAGR